MYLVFPNVFIPLYIKYTIFCILVRLLAYTSYVSGAYMYFFLIPHFRELFSLE